MSELVYQQYIYKQSSPKGKHLVKIWANEIKGNLKYSFSLAYGAGVMSLCEFPKNDYGQFGEFLTLKEALLAATIVLQN